MGELRRRGMGRGRGMGRDRVGKRKEVCAINTSDIKTSTHSCLEGLSVGQGKKKF